MKWSGDRSHLAKCQLHCIESSNWITVDKLGYARYLGRMTHKKGLHLPFKGTAICRQRSVAHILRLPNLATRCKKAYRCLPGYHREYLPLTRHLQCKGQIEIGTLKVVSGHNG
jgi:hypothetical protein